MSTSFLLHFFPRLVAVSIGGSLVRGSTLGRGVSGLGTTFFIGVVVACGSRSCVTRVPVLHAVRRMGAFSAMGFVDKQQ